MKHILSGEDFFTLWSLLFLFQESSEEVDIGSKKITLLLASVLLLYSNT